MNPKSTLTHTQITALFQHHGLAPASKPLHIQRITTGFTNEVYAVDAYILKVCIKAANEPNFRREAFLYELLQTMAPVPHVIAADYARAVFSKPYIIYEKLPGEPAANHWHEMSDLQRQRFVQNLCGYLRAIDNTPPARYSRQQKLEGFDWQRHICDKLAQALAKVRAQKLLERKSILAVEAYIQTTKNVLREQRLGLCLWDVHFDNVLVDDRFRLSGLIDFEHVAVCSIDYRLMTIRLMQQYPWLYLSEAMEPHARREDYVHLLEWYEQFYPELFAFAGLSKRVDLYDLLDVLSKLPDWPHAENLRERLARIVGT